jgi:mRNA-decapping enzyme subunit 2
MSRHEHYLSLTNREQKIEWYRILDLPGGKRQAIAKSDDPQHNKFYMVAPFMNELKRWIKQQRKNDRANSGLHAPEPVLVEDSGFDTDFATTHDEIVAADAPEVADDQAGAGHLQFLLSRLGKSQFEAPLPQPSATSSAQTDQLALELKKLLSVGSSKTAPETPNLPPPPQGNSLMSLLHPGPAKATLPQTPIEQIQTSPPQAVTPHHQNQPPPISDMSPPSVFPFTPMQQPAGRPRHTFSFVNTTAQNYQGPQAQQQPYHQHQHHQQQHHQQHHHAQHHGHHQMQQHFVQGHPPSLSQHPSAGINLPQHFDPPPHPAQSMQRPIPTGFHQTNQRGVPGVPPASSLPQPRLNPQSMALLNTFKAAGVPGPPHAVSPIAHSLELPSENVNPIRQDQVPQNITSAPVQPSSQASQATANGTAGPTHRTAQQNTLLGLFRNPATAQAASARGVLGAPVAELSAGTPQNILDQRVPNQIIVQQRQQHLTARPDGTTNSRLTSATISGPLNAPDFDTVRNNRPPAELGNGSENAQSPVPVHTVDSRIILEAPRPFHPSSILQRQQQFTPLLPEHGSVTATPAITAVPAVQQQPAPPSVPVPVAAFDRRDAQSATQKSTLMSLFGASPAATVGKPYHPVAAANMTSPRHPSLNGSPVSPLPERRVPVKSHPSSTFDAMSPPSISTAPTKSRVSSFDIGAEAPTAVKSQSPITPVDKQFLFQYLEDVVSKEEGN